MLGRFISPFFHQDCIFPDKYWPEDNFKILRGIKARVSKGKSRKEWRDRGNSEVRLLSFHPL